MPTDSARPRARLNADLLLRESGLTRRQIAQRKAFLEFGAADVRRLAALAPVARSYADGVIEELYRHFLAFPQTRNFLQKPGVLKRLKRLQKRYFLRLTSGHYGAAYIKDRLVVGAVHEQIGLNVEFYLGAYRRYLDLVARRLWRNGAATATFDAFNALLKIVFLDIGLAIDTYVLRREQTIRRQNEELARQFQQLQRANQAKNEFLANMSHELRTPLNSIIGFAELLYDHKLGALSGIQNNCVGDILVNGRHLLELINDVLDLAKVESGTMAFRPQPVDLHELIQEARHSFEPLAASKSIGLSMRVDCAAPVLDRVRLRQVLSNYLSNALKFTKPGGSVAVRFHQDRGELVLEVKDSGIGIRKRDVGRLFVDFQQLEGGPSKKYQGTGLGLAITKRIVEAQGGSVGVISKYGAGSTFYARLPTAFSGQESGVKSGSPRLLHTGNVSGRRNGKPTAPKASEVGQAQWRRALEILIVEDNKTTRALSSLQLAAAGYRTDVVEDGFKALALHARHNYDLILMDCEMPGLDGFAATAEIRRREGKHRHTIIIAMTADGSPTQRSRCLAAGMDDFLPKPLTLKVIAATIDRWARAIVARSPLPAPTAQTVPKRTAVERLDHQYIRELHGLSAAAGTDVLSALVDSFGAELPQHVEALKKALRTRDLNALSASTHALKGAAESIGAPGLAQLCNEIGNHLERSNSEGACRAAAVLIAKAPALLKNLKARLATAPQALEQGV